MAEIKEEKKTAVVDDKKYAIITRESIKMMAESVGISELCDEAAAMLCEDVSYRLKEATQVLYRRITIVIDRCLIIKEVRDAVC